MAFGSPLLSKPNFTAIDLTITKTNPPRLVPAPSGLEHTGPYIMFGESCVQGEVCCGKVFFSACNLLFNLLKIRGLGFY